MSKCNADTGGGKSLPGRHAFIDQCRGYAIFGMILVNVLGIFDCMPWMLKHHPEGFSYADHIAPLFIFVVGIGFRRSFLKTARKEGVHRARMRALRRYCILMGLGLVYGGFHLRVGVWDALMDIGASGVLALPVMGAAAWLRLGAAAAYLGLFQFLFSCTPYGAWLLRNSINGGPLGPLSWVFILLLGTFAADCIFDMKRRRMLLCLVFMATVLIATGWLLRMEWPGIKPLWHFSQFAMTAPYPVYAAGLCFLTVLFFYALCEWFGIALPHLTVLGRNPLVLYLLQAALALVARLIVPSNISAVGAVLCFVFIYSVCYITGYRLYCKGRVIKI